MKFLKKYKITIVSIILVIVCVCVNHLFIQPYLNQKKYIDNKDNWYQMNDFHYDKLEFKLYTLNKSHWKLLANQTIDNPKSHISFQCYEIDNQYFIQLLDHYEEETTEDVIIINSNPTSLFNLSQYGFHNEKGSCYGLAEYLNKELNREQCVFQISQSIVFDNIENIDINEPFDYNSDINDESYFMMTVTFQ